MIWNWLDIHLRVEKAKLEAQKEALESKMLKQMLERQKIISNEKGSRVMKQKVSS